MANGNSYQWSEKEIIFLKENFFKLTNPVLAQSLGLKLTSVRTKCYELGLKRMDLEYWTDEQITYLNTNYRSMGDTEISEHFNSIYKKQKGWRKKHIEKKRRYLGLKRTKKQIKKINARNVKMGRFALCPVKAWATRGISKDGDLRKWQTSSGRPFMVIKTKAGFVHYPRHLYKQMVGEIPQGMVVRLKDDDPLNVVPANLELITRADNALKNAGWDYPEEIRTALRTINKIKKTAYEKQNHRSK